MELKSVTFYFEGYEINKGQALKLLQEYANREGCGLTLDDYTEDLRYYGSVDIPDVGVISVVTEMCGIPDEFDFILDGER